MVEDGETASLTPAHRGHGCSDSPPEPRWQPKFSDRSMVWSADESSVMRESANVLDR